MSLKPLRAALALAIGLAALGAAAPASAIDAGSKVNLAIAVPIVVGAGSSGLLSSDELEAYTRPLGQLNRQLDAVFDRPVAIAIDPMIIVSIRILGSNAPQSATDWLNRLASADNEIFALGYSDTDMTLAIQAGSPRVLTPQTFDFAIDPTLFGPPAATPTASPKPTPTPNATPDPNADPQLPTSDDLSAWPYTFESLGWPRGDTVVAGDLPALAASFDSVILSSTNVARSGSATSVVDLGGMKALVSDAPISVALNDAVEASSPESWAAAITALDGSLSAAARVQAGAATVLATLDRGVLADAPLFSETLDALQATPGVTLVPLANVAAEPPSVASLVDMPQDGSRVAEVSSMLMASNAEFHFSSILENPELLTSPRRLQLLALTSNAWHSDTAGWATATADFITQSNDLLASVQVVESSSFNLLADSASIPISVSNALPQAVTVYITVRPETAILAVEDSRVKVVIEPNSQGKGQIPVQAISNGTVDAVVSLSGATGVQIGTPITAHVVVNAGWETPIVAALAILVVGIFALGIVRNIVRRRNTAREIATEE